MPHARPTWAHSLPVALALMAPFDLLASLAMDIYLPIVPAMPSALGTSPAVIQLTLSLYLLGLGLGQILFGPMSDRIGRRPVVLGGALLFAVSSAFMAFTDSAIVFVLLRIAQALGASAALVATFATVRDIYGDRPESVVIYGTFSSMLAFVPALAPILGAIVAVSFGWRGVFWVLSLLAIPPLIHAAVRWHETRPARESESLSSWPILRSGPFWLYTLAFGTAMGTFFVFFSIAPRILIERAGYSELEFSLIFATVAVVMVITARFAKRFVAKWGINGSVRRGMVLLLTGSAILAVARAWIEPGFVSLILPMWLMAVGIVFTVSVTANGALAAFGDRAGLAVAIYFCGQSVIVSVLGTAAVVILGTDTSLPLVVFPAVLATTVLIALRLGHASVTEREIEEILR